MQCSRRMWAIVGLSGIWITAWPPTFRHFDAKGPYAVIQLSSFRPPSCHASPRPQNKLKRSADVRASSGFHPISIAMINHRLTFTVSGGLEGLAEAEVRRLLFTSCHNEDSSPGSDGSATVRWKRRGNSGSQLEVTFPPASQQSVRSQNPAEFVMAAVSSLRYVEYAYLEVLSMNVVDGETTSPPDRDLADLSQRIEQTVASGVCMNRLNEALSIGRKCQIVLKDKAVGLEKLPGQLLPMPKPSTLPSDRPGPGSNREFVVNTIYTKEEVAKVVVEGFMKLVSDQFGEEDDDAKLFVDAGTGGGSLLRNLPPAASIGVDTHPHCTDLDNVLKADFLQLTKAELHGFVADCGKQNSENRRLCIISNPPFSERSRGDYSAIVRFINHSVDLGALCIGVIVPTKFARERVWASLGMNKRVKLLARFLLPNNSFYDPASTKDKNIQGVFLFFGIGDDNHNNDSKAIDCETLPNAIHVIGKRDKRLFSEMATADLSTCVARGLENAGAKLASSEVAECSLSAEIKSTAAGILLELDVLLNPKRPLSLTNSTSRLVAEHSLGWVSNSCKPPVAKAMVQLATECLDDSSPRGCGLFINAMSGEGTIELEAQADDLTTTFFMISGDSDASAALHTKRRLASLAIHSGSGRNKRPRVDMVVWDAQHLPLRRGVADAYLADLPFAGSKKQKHQTPSSSGAAMGASMDYKRVMGQAITVLKPGGRAVLLSADSKGLSIAGRSFNWFERWQSNAVNVGGLWKFK